MRLCKSLIAFTALLLGYAASLDLINGDQEIIGRDLAANPNACDLSYQTYNVPNVMTASNWITSGECSLVAPDPVNQPGTLLYSNQITLFISYSLCSKDFSNWCFPRPQVQVKQHILNT